PPPVAHEKSHKKGPSSSGRLLGFLGGLSKKHGESTSVPPSPKLAQDGFSDAPSPRNSIYQGHHHHQPAQVHPHPPPAPSSGLHQLHQQQQLINQATQRHSVVPTASVMESQKTGHTQRGKRRKTLSLVAATNDRPVSIHQSMRPPMPMDGSNQSHGSGSGTAQKIMGWLRRKSIVKHGNERPQFDLMEEVRYASPSPVPNGSSNPHPMSVSTHGDGSVSAEDSESNPSGSIHGNTPSSIPGPTNTTSVISPIQALEEGKDPTLAALIQALPPNWTDAKLKVHSGAVELSSLSSRHPAEI
ncbi:hypothetical protein BGZ82_004330, partial [Podila clonocystis]